MKGHLRWILHEWVTHYNRGPPTRQPGFRDARPIGRATGRDRSSPPPTLAADRDPTAGGLPYCPETRSTRTERRFFESRVGFQIVAAVAVGHAREGRAS